MRNLVHILYISLHNISLCILDVMQQHIALNIKLFLKLGQAIMVTVVDGGAQKDVQGTYFKYLTG